MAVVIARVKQCSLIPSGAILKAGVSTRPVSAAMRDRASYWPNLWAPRLRDAVNPLSKAANIRRCPALKFAQIGKEFVLVRVAVDAPAIAQVAT